MPNDQEQQALRFLLERLQSSENYCRPYFDRAQRHYKLYRFGTAVPDTDWPYVNRVKTRDILAFIEDSTAILIQTLFATLPFISVMPRESNNPILKQIGIDVSAIAKQCERVLDYQLMHEDTDFLEEMIDFIKAGGIFGNSYINVTPRFEADGMYIIPNLETVDFWDVLPVPGSKRMSKTRGVFVRQFDTMEGLWEKQSQGIYQNVDRVKGVGVSNPDIEWHKRLLEDVGMTEWTQDNDVEILHYFSGGHVITMADRRVFLRDSTGATVFPYPYHMPTVQYKNVPVPGEFFAMGVPEILEILQEDRNLVRSARRDNIDLIINKVITAKAGADINFDFLKYYPGAIWPLENLQDIAPWETGDVTQSAYAEERVIASDMENALSMFGYARGMTPAHSEQPTTVMKLQQASLNRQDVNVKLAEFTVLQEIARKIMALNRRYMTPQTWEAICGEPDAGFFKMPETMINRFFLMKPVGSSVTHIKEIRQAQIQFALESALKFPPQATMTNVQPFTVDIYELLRTAMDTADVKNIDMILKKMPSPQMGMPGMMPGAPPPQMGGGMPPSMPPPMDLMSLAAVPYGGK